jgi:hypothetical protein
MDLSLIKNKLAGLQQKPGQTYEKVDYTKIFWKPKVGTYQVRIVPSKFNKQNPFREVFFHYGFTKGPILALTNWGEKDPIVEFAKKLRKSSDKEDWQLAKKLDAKMRIFAPVIVRGEEHLGTRLWEFGKEIYQQLLGIAADEDYGDFTDIQDGRDFTVEATNGEVAGRSVVKCALRPKPKTTPITTDATLLQNLLDEQPDILTINRRYDFDSLKTILEKFLNPEESNEVDVIANAVPPAAPAKDEPSDLPWENEAPAKPYTLENTTPKATNADKFDSLFN